MVSLTYEATLVIIQVREIGGPEDDRGRAFQKMHVGQRPVGMLASNMPCANTPLCTFTWPFVLISNSFDCRIITAIISRGSQTTESLLVKEREAREAAVKELLQYKLLLAEAEAAQASVQQELRVALTRATREVAAAAELRSQVEAMQVRLGKVQEWRLLSSGPNEI